MDHRCLYGHRVSEDFTFAIKNHQCPICGAPTITVRGYQVARQLTEELKLDALQAFNTLRAIEERFTLTPLAAPPEADAPDATGPAEVHIDQDLPEEIEIPEELPEDDEVIADDEAVDAPDPTDVPSPETPAKPDDAFGSFEDAFFEDANE